MDVTSPFDGIYLPDADGARMARVEEFLRRHGSLGWLSTDRGSGAPRERYFLVGPDPDDRVEVPEELDEVIRTAVESFRYDRAVDMTSLPLRLTVDQAAMMLETNEEHVNGLFDQGTLPSEHGEGGRRVPLHALLEYRKQVQGGPYDNDPDDHLTPEQISERKRLIRREIEEEKRRGGAED